MAATVAAIPHECSPAIGHLAPPSVLSPEMAWTSTAMTFWTRTFPTARVAAVTLPGMILFVHTITLM